MSEDNTDRICSILAHGKSSVILSTPLLVVLDPVAQ